MFSLSGLLRSFSLFSSTFPRVFSTLPAPSLHRRLFLRRTSWIQNSVCPFDRRLYHYCLDRGGPSETSSVETGFSRDPACAKSLSYAQQSKDSCASGICSGDGWTALATTPGTFLWLKKEKREGVKIRKRVIPASCYGVFFSVRQFPASFLAGYFSTPYITPGCRRKQAVEWHALSVVCLSAVRPLPRTS